MIGALERANHPVRFSHFGLFVSRKQAELFFELALILPFPLTLNHHFIKTK
jgi:hypothetical protein